MTFDNIVLYDGDCGFCNFWVQWILKRDRVGRFRFAPLQSGYGQGYLRSRGLPAENFSTLYFLKNGRRYTKMYAVIEIGRTLGGGYRALGLLRMFPKIVLDKIYDMVAKNRKKIAGESCLLPSAEQRERFIS